MSLKMLMQTKELDKGYSKYMEQVDKMKDKPYIKIGILEEDGGDKEPGSDITLAGIAAVHEFGSDKINMPSRSFIRSTMDENKNRFLNITAKALINIGKGADIFQQLGLIGLDIESKIKAKIRSKIPPPNAPETIARKGSSTPLIDTGRLINSIRHKVYGSETK